MDHGRDPRMYEFRDRLPEPILDAVQAAVKAEARARAAELEAEVEENLRAVIQEYFNQMHTGMWGRAFDLFHNRRAAEDFIIDLYRGLGAIMLGLDKQAAP